MPRVFKIRQSVLICGKNIVHRYLLWEIYYFSQKVIVKATKDIVQNLEDFCNRSAAEWGWSIHCSYVSCSGCIQMYRLPALLIVQKNFKNLIILIKVQTSFVLDRVRDIPADIQLGGACEDGCSSFVARVLLHRLRHDPGLWEDSGNHLVRTCRYQVRYNRMHTDQY